MPFKYWLPGENSENQERNTDSNSVIIIGANGSGKSKLGAWIEKENFNEVHRVGAQRNLNFNENIALKSYSQAEDLVFWGTDIENQKKNKGYRWNWGNEYTTKLMDDFEHVLAALLALKNNQNNDYVEACKVAEKANQQKPHTPTTSIDTLKSVWADVYPHRTLLEEDSKFYASFEKDETIIRYSANQMSDGERSVLYLAAQVLCVPNNKIIIIDEPEIHLHRSIMNRLWVSLEKNRPDCLFIYITHDTQFAAMHSDSDKIWIRKYDGQNWEMEDVNETDLPEELLLDILGNRNNVLFVEGETNSYDTQLYCSIYPNYHIIPCGSCSQVIQRVKAFRNSKNLHNCLVYGIIDRDYRSQYEIDKFKEENIFTLNVAEVENLFITEELIKLMAEHMGKNPVDVFESIKKYIVNTRFKNQIDNQICQSTVAQIKYKLASAEISRNSAQDAKESLDSAFASIKYDELKEQETIKFQDALTEGNYAKIIRIFNEKNLSKSVGQYFGIDNKSYCSIIISLLKSAKECEIVESLLSYIPQEINR